MFTHTNEPITLSDRDQVLNNMLAVRHITFHLNGSRYFGNATDKSDWDFFAETLTDNGLAQWLAAKGFTATSNPRYSDSQTLSVWHHPSGIDVQEVKSVRLKLAAQTILRCLFGGRAKELSARHWNAATSAASEIFTQED